MADPGTKVEGWLKELGAAGTMLYDMGAAEGGAGNLSLFLPDNTIGLRGLLLARMSRQHPFPAAKNLNLPTGAILMSGSRRRLRDIAENPEANLCAIEIEENGSTWLHYSDDHPMEPTSEVDSHLAIHATSLAGVARPHAVAHAQPPNLTYLSHIPEYANEERFNRQVLRWQPETIVVFPEGIRILPFVTPGSPELGKQTGQAARHNSLIIWSKHGVIAHADRGPLAAVTLIEYAEAAAHYEVLDIQCGRSANGLTIEDLRGIAKRFQIDASLLDSLPEDLL